MLLRAFHFLSWIYMDYYMFGDVVNVFAVLFPPSLGAQIVHLVAVRTVPGIQNESPPSFESPSGCLAHISFRKIGRRISHFISYCSCRNFGSPRITHKNRSSSRSSFLMEEDDWSLVQETWRRMFCNYSANASWSFSPLRQTLLREVLRVLRLRVQFWTGWFSASRTHDSALWTSVGRSVS